MTKTSRKRLILLGTTSMFALAMAAAPVQFSSVTPDLAVAQAAGGGGDSGDRGPNGEGGGGSSGGAGSSGGSGGPGGSGTTSGTGAPGGSGSPTD